MILRAFLSAMLAGLCMGASCVDTELSLDMQLRSATVTLSPDDALSIELVADVRVGKHALSGDNFIVPRADVLLASGDPVGQINLMRPDGFVGRLEPGESVTLDLMGDTPANAFPAARAVLCTGADVQVVVNWQAEEQADDPLDPPIMSFGTATIITNSVICP